MGRSRASAGLLMFRKQDHISEVLLAHPGGPFFRNKDDGVWTIPKGEVGENEDLVSRAKIEFEEELGIKPPPGKLIELGSVKQKGGKIVYAWAVEGDLANDFELSCNIFEMEWPPRSGKRQQFPEIDRAIFFPVEQARVKINPAQVVFLERLIDALGVQNSSG